MPHFGTQSRLNREELHPDLQRIADIAIQGWDFTIVDAGRTLAEQKANVKSGASQTMHSKHLIGADGKAHAMDCMPYPVDWIAVEQGLQAIKRIPSANAMAVLEAYMFSGYIAGIAAALGIKIRQGTDWDGDRQFEEHSFTDIPHTELVG